MAFDASFFALLFGHRVEHAHRAAAIDQGAGTACVLDGIAVLPGTALAYVMNKVDRAILMIGDLCPCFDDGGHLIVVVLGEARAVDEWVDDDEVDRVLADRFFNVGDDLLVEFDVAALALARDDKIFLAAAVRE